MACSRYGSPQHMLTGCFSSSSHCSCPVGSGVNKYNRVSLRCAMLWPGYCVVDIALIACHSTAQLLASRPPRLVRRAALSQKITLQSTFSRWRWLQLGQSGSVIVADDAHAPIVLRSVHLVIRLPPTGSNS